MRGEINGVSNFDTGVRLLRRLLVEDNRVTVTRCYRISLKLQRTNDSIIPVSNPDAISNYEGNVSRNKFEGSVSILCVSRVSSCLAIFDSVDY